MYIYIIYIYIYIYKICFNAMQHPLQSKIKVIKPRVNSTKMIESI